MVESEKPKPHKSIRVHLLFVCGLLSILPLMFLQVTQLWNRPHFRFFAVAWLLFGLVVISEPKIGFAASVLRRRVGVGLTLTGFVISLVAAIFVSPGIGQLALIALVTGWILVWLGIVPWTRVVALTGLLWITWPLPMNVDLRLISWLNERAARTVSPLLDLLSTPNLMFAGQLDLRHDRIELANIAGGLNSVFLLAFFAILLLLAFRRSLVVSALSLLLVPALSWLQNALHILILTWAQESLGADWSVGSMHIGLSIGLFVLSLVFLLMVIDGISFLLEPLPVELAQQGRVGFHGLYNRTVLWPGQLSMAGEEAEDDDYFDEDEAHHRSRDVQRQGPPVRLTLKATDPWRESHYTWLVAAGFLLIGLFATLGYVVTTTREAPSLPSYSAKELAAIASEETLPAQMHGLERKAAQLIAPKSSQPLNTYVIVWRYNATEGSSVISVDFPHFGMQERWKLAAAMGWKLKGQPKRLVIGGEGGGEGWPVVEVELENELGSSAYALYSAFDQSGNPAMPQDSWEASLERRFESTVFGQLLSKRTVVPITFQTQLFLETGAQLSDSRRSEYRAAMVDATAALKQRVIGGIVK